MTHTPSPLTKHHIHLHETSQDAPRAVVFLHSSGFSGRQWRAYTKPLESQGWHTLCPDLIGYGQSAPWDPNTPFHFSYDLDVAHAVIETLQGKPYALVGHSYGGLIAAHTALRHTQHPPQALALFEPVLWGVFTDAGTEDDRKAFHIFEETGFFDDAIGGSPQWMQRFVDYWNGAGAWERLGERAQDQMMHAGRKTFEEVRALCFDETPAHTYTKLLMPTLIVHGHQSPPQIQRVCTLLDAHIPETVHKTFPMGHMGPVTHANILAPVLTEWLECVMNEFA